MNLKELVKEASISIACLLDDLVGINFNDLQKDIEHIQNQITKIENITEENADESC